MGCRGESVNKGNLRGAQCAHMWRAEMKEIYGWMWHCGSINVDGWDGYLRGGEVLPLHISAIGTDCTGTGVSWRGSP